MNNAWNTPWGRRVLSVILGLIGFLFVAAPLEAAECRRVGEVCVEGGGVRNIGGTDVYRDCWRYRDTFECKKPESIDYCAPFYNLAGCWQTSTKCIAAAWDGTCLTEQRTYRCDDPSMPPPPNTVVLDKTYTITKDALDTKQCDPYPGDDDFARVVAGKEAAREAGVYGAESNNFFKGVAESCRKGFGGLKNCCKTDPGAKSNNTIMMQAAGGAVKFGAKYAFDYMYKSSEWIQAGMSALGYDGIEMASNFGASFGMYGVSYTVGGAALAAGETTTGMFGQTIYGLGNGFAFDPYSFAAAIAIQIVMELMSCEQDEMQLGMHRGAHLCHFVGSY